MYDSDLRDSVNVRNCRNSEDYLCFTLIHAACFDNLLRDVSTFTSRFIERGISSILIDRAKQICFVSIHL